MKNEELGGGAAYAPAGVSESFMTHHKAFGGTCGNIKFARAVEIRNGETYKTTASDSTLHTQQ